MGDTRERLAQDVEALLRQRNAPRLPETERTWDHASGAVIDSPRQPVTPTVLAPYPLEDWRPEHGDVVWWRFPVVRPPYIGQPEDTDWPGIHTHWTPIPMAPGEAP